MEETSTSSDLYHDARELPEDFCPSENDVICGWARQNYNHAGNRRLRDLIDENVPHYMKAKTKGDKGQVIIDLLQRIRQESPSGMGLVRRNPKTGRWSYIGVDKAKDKIGHALRKATQEFVKSHRLREKRREKQRNRRSTTPSTTHLMPIGGKFIQQSTSMGSLTVSTAAESSPSSTPPTVPSSPIRKHGGNYYDEEEGDDGYQGEEDTYEAASQQHNAAEGHPPHEHYYYPPTHYYPYAYRPPPHAAHGHYPPPPPPPPHPHYHYPQLYPPPMPPAPGYYYGHPTPAQPPASEGVSDHEAPIHPYPIRPAHGESPEGIGNLLLAVDGSASY